MAKATTSWTTSSKNTSDFSLNQDYDDTKVIYDSSTRTWDDPDILWDGVDPTLSSITNKNQTDFAKTTKTSTGFTAVTKNTTSFTEATKNITSWTE